MDIFVMERMVEDKNNGSTFSVDKQNLMIICLCLTINLTLKWPWMTEVDI
jgi:hypothetical protein